MRFILTSFLQSVILTRTSNTDRATKFFTRESISVIKLPGTVPSPVNTLEKRLYKALAAKFPNRLPAG